MTMNFKLYVFLTTILFSFTVVGQCLVPTNITVDNITASNAQFFWDESTSSPGVGYQFELRTSGAPGSGASGLFLSGNVEDGLSSVSLESLLVNQEFTFYIRYQCTADPTFSPWSTGLLFNTLDISAPVAINPLYLSNESFVASWLGSSGAISYLLDISETSDFSTFIIEELSVNLTSFVALNLTPTTDYFYRVRAVSNNNTISAFSNVIQVTTLTDPLSFVIWTEAGWSADPLLELDAIIDFDYNTGLNFGFECKSLTINEGFVLTIADGTNVIVEDEIIIEGNQEGIVVENNANLVQLNDFANNNQGRIRVVRDSSPLFRLDYTLWSSPTSSPLNSQPQTLKEFSPGTLNNRFYGYNTLGNIFTVIADPVNTPFEAGLGYLIRVRNNHVPYVDENSIPEIWTGIFTGIPNNGFIEVPVSDDGKGCNMIGNPYPSVISAEDFINLNIDDIEGELYFWRRRNTQGGGGDIGTFYATYNLGGATSSTPTSEEPNGFIQIGQGFALKVENGIDSVVFSNDLRVADEFDNQFFRPSILSEKHRVWLNLTNDQGVFSQMMLGYHENATDGYDKGYDTKLFMDSNVYISTLLGEMPLTIQSKSLPFELEDVVKVKLSLETAGEYTIALSKFDGVFETDQPVYLFDKSNSLYHNLKESSFTFFSESGEISNRFELRFQNETLSIENPDLIENDSLVLYQNNNRLNLKSSENQISEIVLFDITGRKIIEFKEVNNLEFVIDRIAPTKQYYLLKIKLANNTTVIKKTIF